MLSSLVSIVLLFFAANAALAPVPDCGLCHFVRSAPGSDFTAAAHPNGGPSRIILMRHADKPDDPDDPDLSAAGVTRAEHLATYIPQTFGKPDYIIATARSKHSDRPLETVEPLAQAVGVSVQHDIRDKDFEDLVDEIFSDAAYRGKTVVISWHHGTLPAIAALLGARRGATRIRGPTIRTMSSWIFATTPTPAARRRLRR